MPVFLVVPLFAALLVWFTFALGRALDDEVTGLGAAVLLACSPIFLYQAVQPMSDVPAAALWLAAFVFCVRGTVAGRCGRSLRIPRRFCTPQPRAPGDPRSRRCS